MGSSLLLSLHLPPFLLPSFSFIEPPNTRLHLPPPLLLSSAFLLLPPFLPPSILFPPFCLPPFTSSSFLPPSSPLDSSFSSHHSPFLSLPNPPFCLPLPTFH